MSTSRDQGCDDENKRLDIKAECKLRTNDLLTSKLQYICH